MHHECFQTPQKRKRMSRRAKHMSRELDPTCSRFGLGTSFPPPLQEEGAGGHQPSYLGQFPWNRVQLEQYRQWKTSFLFFLTANIFLGTWKSMLVRYVSLCPYPPFPFLPFIRLLFAKLEPFYRLSRISLISSDRLRKQGGQQLVRCEAG